MSMKSKLCALAAAVICSMGVVSAGAALAASAEVDVEVQPEAPAPDTANILLRPGAGSQKVRVRLNNYSYEGSANFDGLYLELVQPDGSIAKGKTVSDKLKMTQLSSSSYEYELELAARNMTGLYCINVYPYRGNMHLTDGSGKNIPAFYYATGADASGGVFKQPADGGSTGFRPLSKYSPSSISGAGQIYMTKGSSVEYRAELGALPVGVSSVNIKMIDPATGRFFSTRDRLRANAVAADTLTLGNVGDGSSMQFKVLAVSDGDNGEQLCQLYTLTDTLTGNSLDSATIDTAGPEIGDISITNPAFYMKEQQGFMYAQISGNPTTYVEVGKISDKGAGVALADADSRSYIRFVNPASPSHTFGGSSGARSTRLVAGDANAPLYKGRAGSAMLGMDMQAGGSHSGLANSQWRMQVVAVDVLGNETVREYGRVNIFDRYKEVSSIRVESVNELEMYAGQQLSLKQLEQMGISAYTNADASFPDAWTWTISANMLGIVEYNPETGILTALKAGEGRITAIALSRYENDAARGSDYLAIKVLAEPRVHSLELDRPSIQLKPGEETQLKATVDPDYARVSWESKDSGVVSVDAAGNVKAVDEGVTIIVARANDKMAICSVSVQGDITARSIVISKEQLSLNTGQSEQLYAGTTPGGLPIEWSSSDSSIAKVDGDGVVSAIRPGTATITASSGSQSASCKLTVRAVATANKWVRTDKGWVYYDENARLTYGWKKIASLGSGVSRWYYFDEYTGIMRTGWFKDKASSLWYYLNPESGAAQGAMATGWLRDGRNPDGSECWYYLLGDGSMMAGGWRKITVSGRANWYYFKSSGAMATGWVKDGGAWYYLDSTGGDALGAMLTGTHTIDGRSSRFDSGGRWLGYV